VCVGRDQVAVGRIGAANHVAGGTVDYYAIGVATGEQGRYIGANEAAGDNVKAATFNVDALGAETVDDQAAHGAVARQQPQADAVIGVGYDQSGGGAGEGRGGQEENRNNPKSETRHRA